ncbi:hypothetical protein RDI58_004651 [Solanum bulbocastanum]|uniref:Uncharacterized protein n=1 Tax=Solanum bulbocastanum TaxID=147425 RepID=A0AAN8TZ55_SOLBU
MHISMDKPARARLLLDIHIDGTLLAPSDYNVIGNDQNWIKFEKVNGVSIYGGTFDGLVKVLLFGFARTPTRIALMGLRH